MKERVTDLLPESVRNSIPPLTKKGRLIRKVKARKCARAASPYKYSDSPTVSLVIQSFNHRDNIKIIVERLRLTAAEELIVCEDGSVDGSEKAWRKLLTHPNDFLIQSNDIHEIRTYNRAVSLARGEFICLLQDDDIPPANPRWFDDAIRLFRKYPKLAILGAWNGWTFDFNSSGDSFGSPVGSNTHTGDGRLDLVEPETRIPFQFVDAVGIGPLLFRRADFEALGGFDLQLSRPGEPGIWLDYDLCLRAWFSGRQVGVYETPAFERNIGGQGTKMFSASILGENFHRNWKRSQTIYADRIGSLPDMTISLNSHLSKRA